MSRLVRWSTTLGVAGFSLLGLGIGGNLIALALSQEEVLKKLEPVPVFTIVDEQGAPLVASGENKAKVAGAFISQADANQFVAQLKTKNPELANQVRVVPVSLGEVYKLSEKAKIQENPLNFAYIPEEETVNSAKTLGEANQQPYQGGVPLFVAKGGEDKDYLTIEQDSQQVIPFFFDKAQLEEMVAKLKQQKPEIADSIDIEVVPLEEIIETLETGEDRMLQKIVLVPTEESIAFLASQDSGQLTSEQLQDEMLERHRAVMEAHREASETMGVQHILIP